MGMLKDKDKKKLIDIFKTIENEIKIIFFTQEMECQYCGATRDILEEISSISDKIHLDIYDFVADADLAKKHGVDKIPATVLVGDKDYGIHFYGVPGGYEFNVLIEDIINIGKRDAELSDDVMAELNKIDQPVHLKVLISPT